MQSKQWLWALPALAIPKLNPMTTDFSSTPLKGNIKQSVCQWCYGNIPLETLAQEAKKLGLVGIDLIGAEGWDVLKKYDLTSTMCYGDLEGKSTRSLTDGWNDKRFHKDLIKHYTRHIKLVADAGWTNLICFSGSRRGMSDTQGLEKLCRRITANPPHSRRSRCGFTYGTFKF
jgi:sugar phosphate isomerase/epimerase